jgi:cytochrome P450
VWSLVLLHQHPAAAQRVRDEAVAACGAALPELRHTAQMPFALQVFKETLRLYPPVFVVGREAAHPVTIGPWQIDGDAWVMIAPSVVQRNPTLFPAPDVFTPERMTAEFEKSLPRGAYIPFGLGPRICIGNAFSLMEGQAVLATLLPRVALELTGPPPGVKPMITLGPDAPVLARVRRLTGAG